MIGSRRWRMDNTAWSRGGSCPRPRPPCDPGRFAPGAPPAPSRRLRGRPSALTIEGNGCGGAAAGPGAALSHRDAAALHGMRSPPESRKVSVDAGRRGTRRVRVRAAPARRGRPHGRPRHPGRDPAARARGHRPDSGPASSRRDARGADRRGLLDVEPPKRALRRTRGRQGQATGAWSPPSLPTTAWRGSAVVRAGGALPRPGPPRRSPAARARRPRRRPEVDALWPREPGRRSWTAGRTTGNARRPPPDREKTHRFQLAGYAVAAPPAPRPYARPERVVQTIRAALAAGR